MHLIFLLTMSKDNNNDFFTLSPTIELQNIQNIQSELQKKYL